MVSSLVVSCFRPNRRCFRESPDHSPSATWLLLRLVVLVSISISFILICPSPPPHRVQHLSQSRSSLFACTFCSPRTLYTLLTSRPRSLKHTGPYFERCMRPLLLSLLLQLILVILPHLFTLSSDRGLLCALPITTPVSIDLPLAPVRCNAPE